MKIKPPALVFLMTAFLTILGKQLSFAENCGPVTVRLWPDRPQAGEREEPGNGRNVCRITDITDPSISFYPVHKDGQLAPSVLVCPGGGYRILAIDLEGTEIAEWLNSIGFSAAVLKYTVPDNRPAALQDVQRAMRLIRAKNKEWGIDPNRLGVIGFSAGGHLAARLSTSYTVPAYAPVDAADLMSCRPDFTILIYPAYLGDETYHLPDGMAVAADTPSAFIVQTQDDRAYVNSSIAYALALKAQHVPVELHLFPDGGHGFGLRPSDKPVSHWPELCERWLKTRVVFP